MLPLVYQNNKFALVTDKGDFFKGNLPEMRKLKSMVDKVKLLFSLPDDRVNIYVAQGERNYKIEMLTTDVKRLPFANIYYLPLYKRIDIEDENGILLQWINRKPVFKNFSMLLDRAGASSLFDSIINVS